MEEISSTRDTACDEAVVVPMGALLPHCTEGGTAWGSAGPFEITLMGTERLQFQPGAVHMDERIYTVADHLDPQLIAAELSRVDHVVAVHAGPSGEVTHVWTVVQDEAYDDDEKLSAVFQTELKLHSDYGGKLLASIEFHVLSESSARRLALGEQLY